MKILLKKTLLFGVLLLTSIGFGQKKLMLDLGLNHANTHRISFIDDDTFLIVDYSNVKLYNLKQGKLLKVYPVSAMVDAFALHPNKKSFLVAKYHTGIIEQIDIKTGNVINRFINHVSNDSKNTQPIESISFNSIGSHFIATGSNDNKINVFDINKPKPIKEFLTSHTSKLIMLPNDKSFISLGDDNIIKIRDLNTGSIIKELKQQHSSPIISLGISKNGKQIFSSEKEIGKLTIRDLESEKLINSFTRDDPFYGSFSPSGEYFIESGFFTEIKIWDLKNKIIIKHIKAKEDAVSSAFFHQNNNSFLYINNEGEGITWYDIEKNKKLKSFATTLHLQSASPIKYLNNGLNFLTAKKNSIQLFNFKTGKIIKEFKREVGKPINSVYEGGIYALEITPDEKYFFCGDFNGNVELWDIEKQKKIRTYQGVPNVGHTKLIRNITISENQKYFFYIDWEYIQNVKKGNVNIFELSTGKLITSFNLNDRNHARFYFDNETLLFAEGLNPLCRLFNLNTGKAVKRDEKNINVSKLKPIQNNMFLCSNNVYSPNQKTYISGDRLNGDIKLNSINDSILKEFKGHNFEFRGGVFTKNGNTFFSGSDDKTIKCWDVSTGKDIYTLKGHSERISGIWPTPNEKHLLSQSINETCLWEVATGKLLATTFIHENGKDYVVTTPGGHFDGTEKGMGLLYYVDGLDVYPLSSLFEEFYTPRLWERVLNGEKFTTKVVDINSIKLPPLVKITNLNTGTSNRGAIANTTAITSTKKQIDITITATDQGGGIDEIRLYQNNKLIASTKNNNIPLNKPVTFTIELLNGKNSLKATAYSKQRTETVIKDIRTITYKGIEKTSNLYVLAIGINQYKNKKYNLNYAVADAKAITEQIEVHSSNIFNKVSNVFISNSEATRERILQEFIDLKQKVQPQDVFMFYYAGHGVMSLDDKPQFFIAPYNVTKLYAPADVLATKAISAEELKQFSGELKAQKQLFALDACQSGGLTEHLASRGAPEEKAIAQLARSTGTYWLTASGTEQYATEFESLGHGLFTYCMLQGLKGEADRGSFDQKVTVKELSTFLDDAIPTISEKHKGTEQYPTIYGYGNDFPIVIIKK